MNEHADRDRSEEPADRSWVTTETIRETLRMGALRRPTKPSLQLLHERAGCRCVKPHAPGEGQGDPLQAAVIDAADADQKAHLHTTSKAKGHVQHPTVTRTHPTTHCHREGCIRS